LRRRNGEANGGGKDRSQFADRYPLARARRRRENFSLVIAGLDPAIHAATSLVRIRRMV
jgi:hypothetical protein